MKKILLTLIIFIVASCSSQNVTTKVLAKGTIYNWQISKMTDNNETAIYFTLSSGQSKNSNGFYIGIDSIEELKSFISLLRVFADSPISNDYYTRYDSFVLKRYINTTDVILFDYSELKWLRLSKTNSKSLATDIEKSITLMQ